MSQELTPYDTGERLEPHRWVTEHTGPKQTTPRDRFGRVDFDNDEGRTALSLYVERTAQGYTLHVERSADVALTVEVHD